MRPILYFAGFFETTELNFGIPLTLETTRDPIFSSGEYARWKGSHFLRLIHSDMIVLYTLFDVCKVHVEAYVCVSVKHSNFVE